VATDGAKEHFSQSQTCPLDRVEVRERPELKPSQFYKSPAPPADVAADPGRLQMWRNTQAENAANHSKFESIVEARGCDKHVFYACSHPTSTSGNERWSCTEERDVPDGISKW
jgi:hypothetical protein